MPLSRYQIRNEYSLADPELYRAADKDDPEALLEGVAMAGLVGVLRQLGDLAEFAAEIFHDLHEEVMATAARGHGLMVRVQQLEVEFPSIEKAFLSQTNHSQFISNPGVEWHPNLHADQNLITRGDLPRFVMDSYEECRGPPRLFLLDKFDVAGAGACLKRYTDPSIYKVETTSNGRTTADVQRERKARRVKKKGSRMRNGETPEILPTSHIKLQQLLLEERIENGIGDPARLVKLKRRSNGSPFNSKMGKSYMEKIINIPLPEDKRVHEISIASHGLMLPSIITTESGLEMVEISEENYLEMNSSKDDFTNEREIEVDEERKADANGDNYQYDEIGSEVDNYVDALATMESEIETDTEIKAKSNPGFFNIDKQYVDSVANKVQLQAQFSDSQSVGNSTASDDGNSSSKKGISSFSCSDTASTSAENTPANVFPSSEHFENGVTSMSSSRMSSDEEIAVIQTYHTDLAPSEFPVEELAFTIQRPLEEQDSDDQLDCGSGRAEENAKDVDVILPFTSKLSDVPLETNYNLPNPASSIDQSVDNVNVKESSVFSGELEVAPEIESREVLQAILVQTEDGASPNSVTSVAEEPSFVPALPEFEICHPDVIDDVAAAYLDPSGEKIEEVNSSEAEDTPDAREYHISERADVVKETEIVEQETLVEVVAVSEEEYVNSQYVHFTDLQDECISTIVKESDQKGLEVGETCAEHNHHKEPGTSKEDNQQAAAASPDSNVQFSSDYSSSDLVNNVPDDNLALAINEYTPGPTQTADAENVLHLDDVIALPTYSGNNNDHDSDTKSPELNYLIEDTENTMWSPTHSFVERQVNIQPIQNLDSSAQPDNLQSPKHLDQETPVDAKQKVELPADEVDCDSASELEQMQRPLNQTNKERCFDASLEPSAADCPSEAPATELLTQSASHRFEMSEQAREGPLPFGFPVFGLVPVVSEINLEDMPPLPPLPPVQWRMGKPSLSSNRAGQHCNIEHFRQMFSLNPFEPHAAVGYGNSQTVMNTVHSSPIALPVQNMPSVNSEYHAHPVNPFLEMHETYKEKAQDSSLDEQVVMDPYVNPLSTLGTSSNASSSAHASGDQNEQLIPPLHQLPHDENSADKKIEVLKVEEQHQLPEEENMEDKKIQVLGVDYEQHQLPEENNSVDKKIQVLKDEVKHHHLPQEENLEDKKIQVLKIEDEQPQYVPMVTEGGFMWSSSAAPFATPVQDGIPNGNRPLKLMRPRSPLIDAVAAHDKSKLRKVTERVRPRIQKVDERDSLLEQIRTKSFNLKPAVATRPSIQGPKTNLRVAAILEKANAIRQALAGSDEDDDEDSWSSD